MNSKEIAQELKQQEEELSVMIKQLDGLYYEIQKAMPSAASIWIDREVENRIESNAVAVQLLGIDKLKELKSEVTSFQSQLPELVASEFEDHSKWPHHSQTINESTVALLSNRQEGHLFIAFRNVISGLGKILNKYRLLDEPKGYTSLWEQVGREIFQYKVIYGLITRHNYEQYRTLNERFESYYTLLKGYVPLKIKIEETRKSLDKEKAKEMWEKA